MGDGLLAEFPSVEDAVRAAGNSEEQRRQVDPGLISIVVVSGGRESQCPASSFGKPYPTECCLYDCGNKPQ